MMTDIHLVLFRKNDIFSALIRDKPCHAFILLWDSLNKNHPLFLKAESTAIGDPNFDNDVKSTVEEIVKGNDTCLRRVLETQPLLILRALDEYLLDLYDNQDWETPPPPIAVGSERYLLHRREITQSAPVIYAEKSGHLQSWLHHHWIIPEHICGYRIERYPANRTLQRCCEAITRRGELRIYVGHFPDCITPEWLSHNPSAWLAFELNDREVRWQSVVRVLKQAAAEQADVVVLPELSLCPTLRQRVIEWLDDHADNPFTLVLPGTFHLKEKASPAGEVHNEGVLLDHLGYQVLTHWKLTYFRAAGRIEAITPGDCIKLLSTPIGLIGIPICLDFCEEGNPLGTLWEKVGAEWLLVPAFGNDKSIDAHSRKAEQLARAHATVSVIANQHPDGIAAAYGFVCYDGGPAGGRVQRIICNNNRCVTVKWQQTKLK